MNAFLRRISAAYSGGTLGALLGSLALWFAARQGYLASINVNISPALTLDWLYPRLILGGLWGFIFLLPLTITHPIQRGVFFSLAPSALQLFIIYPYHTSHGMLGMGLGAWTPAVVIAVNLVWGLCAALWYKMAGE